MRRVRSFDVAHLDTDARTSFIHVIHPIRIRILPTVTRRRDSFDAFIHSFDDGFYPRDRSRGRAAERARGERERGGRRGESARGPGDGDDDDARRWWWWWWTDAGTGDDDDAGRRRERGWRGGGVRQETRGVRERSCVVTARRGEARRGGERG